MPQFYIHVLNQDSYLEDKEGQDLVDLEAARKVAVNSAAEIVAEDIRLGKSTIKLTFFIDDAGGQRLMELPVQATLGHRTDSSA